MHHAHKIRPEDVMNPDLVSAWVLIGTVVGIVGALVALFRTLLE